MPRACTVPSNRVSIITTPKLRPARTTNERMIKVDHAGENGAVAIYRAQSWMVRWRDPKLLSGILENLAHEKQHRDIFKVYLAKRNIRRCICYHICGIGGTVLGLITGLIGGKAVAATTYAVESVVLQHLETQLAYLQIHDQEAYDAVCLIITDEQAHHDQALLALKGTNFWTNGIIKIVRLSTELVIRFGMRQPLKN